MLYHSWGNANAPLLTHRDYREFSIFTCGFAAHKGIIPSQNCQMIELIHFLHLLVLKLMYFGSGHLNAIQTWCYVLIIYHSIFIQYYKRSDLDPIPTLIGFKTNVFWIKTSKCNPNLLLSH